MRLAICASHPIQYQAPFFRELAGRLDLTVFYATRANPSELGEGFVVDMEWDVDLLSGYRHVFLTNVAAEPGVHHARGCDTPEIGRRLAEGGFDAVLILGWHLKTFHQALFAAKRLRLPALLRGDSHLETQRSLPKRLAKAAIYPVFLRLYDAALAVGVKSRAYWRHYGYPADRIFFAPHAVDAPWFADRATPAARADLRARHAIGPDERVVLFAGKLTDKKRPLDLVAAGGALGRDGFPVRLLVAGSGPLEADLRARAAADGVPLTVLGFCNQSAMPAAYAASDVLALTSESETWGLVTNEALACGRPLVLSDAVGAAPDLVADGSVGRAYPVGNVSALAQALRTVLTDPPGPDAIAAKSRAYSLAAAADGVEAALRACVKRRRAA